MRWPYTVPASSFWAASALLAGWFVATRIPGRDATRAATSGQSARHKSAATIGASIVTRAERNGRALRQAGMLPMSKPKDDDKPAESEVDERWLGEWIKYGAEQLDKFMQDHAAFDEFCRRREENNEAAS